VRILFLSPRQCWPASSGARLREYHFLRALGRHADLTYLYFQDRDTPPLTRVDLPFCRGVSGVTKPDRYGPANILLGVAGRWPLPVLNYWSSEMRDAVGRASASQSYDVFHLDSIHMTRYSRFVGGSSPKVIYNWHNIESEAMRRYAAVASNSGKRWYAAYTAGKLAALESEILRSAFAHVVCSERERAQLLRTAPAARIEVVENGVDTEYFTGAAGPASNKIVFVGAMDYFPNVEAITSFATRIWPQVQNKIPDMRLDVVGANPTPAVRRLGEMTGISITGTVPDVRPYYRDSLAAIVPLRTGGGTRLKILEAMAAGVPVISTPLGAEGLGVTAGQDILIADPDSRDGWVEHILELSRRPLRREQLAGAARRLVLNRYDWKILGDKLSRLYEKWQRADS